MLGPIRMVAPGGGAVAGAVAGELRVAVLAYLALGMPGARRRDTLLGMFWPEAREDEARHRLRQVLYVLRRELGDGVLQAHGREQIGVNPDRFWCDAVAFEDAIRSGDLVRAQALYAGELCDGVYLPRGGTFERWVERERDRLRRRAVESAWALCTARQADGALRDALRWGRRALELEPDEGRLAQLLELCMELGDRIGALQMFARFERMLAEEYELTPSEETLRVVETIRANGRAALSAVAAPALPFGTPARR